MLEDRFVRYGRDMTLPRTNRRSFLVGASAFVVAACSGSGDAAPEPAPLTTSTTSTLAPTTTQAGEAGNPFPSIPASFDEVEPLDVAWFELLPICAIPPESTAGPFPTIEQLDRRDISEGYPGHPFRLGIRVVDAECSPLPGAEVEIWHTDASGDYSSYLDEGSGKDEGEGTTFCRGFQTADADGLLEFQTIYPGWYEGRAVHIHVRARVGGEEVLTTQLYFDEGYTEAVFDVEPYVEFGPPDTMWLDDPIAEDPIVDGSAITLTAAMTTNGEGTLGLINLGLPV